MTLLPGDPSPQQTAAATNDERNTMRLLSTTDAREWAQEFLRLFGDKPEAIDEGLMIAWFANAIETGRTAGERVAA